MLQRTLLAALLVLAVSLWPHPASAAPATFQDVTLWLAHAQVGQLPQCYDLRVEARVNGALVATATTYPLAPFCVQYYGRIEYVRLPFVTVPGATVNPGNVVETTVLARLAPLSSRNLSTYGSLRLHYNGWYPFSQSDSYVRADLGAGPQAYHFLAGSQLSPLPPGGPPLSNVQYQIFRYPYAYTSLGTWGMFAP
jgi:hypothetical protein